MVVFLLRWDKVSCSSEGGASRDVMWEYNSYLKGDLFADCDFKVPILLLVKHLFTPSIVSKSVTKN